MRGAAQGGGGGGGGGGGLRAPGDWPGYHSLTKK